MFGLSNTHINNIKTVLSNYSAIDEAIVYGSRAVGKQKPGSDIDIALKGDISFGTLLQLEVDLDDQMLPYAFDVSLFKNLTHQALVAHIKKFGKLLYKKPLE